MDFHQLRVFVEVAKQKNFSRAAENIFLSQPTVSAHVKALENEIGTPLFDRSQRELMLTEGGKTLFKFAQEILEIKEKALSAIQENYSIVQGHLEIAASSVPGAYLLPGLLRSFNRKYPGITFSVLLRDTQQAFESIRDYTYDLGFTGKPVTGKGLEQIKLVEDQLILIAPPGTNLAQKAKIKSGLFPVKLKTCLDYPFILREPGSATRLVFEKALQKRFGRAPGLRVIAYLESQEAVKEAVKAGLGLTVISRRAAEEELRIGSIEGYNLEELDLKRNFYLIYRKKRVLPPLSHAFLDFTMKHFGIKI